MGKGSSPRPYSVNQQTFDNNWDLIFNKKSKPQIICPKCGVDRAQDECPGPIMHCPMVGEAQFIKEEENVTKKN